MNYTVVNFGILSAVEKKCSAKNIVYKSMCVQLILSDLFALFCIQSEAH